MIQLVVFKIDFTDEGLRRNPALTNVIKDDRSCISTVCRDRSHR